MVIPEYIVLLACNTKCQEVMTKTFKAAIISAAVNDDHDFSHKLRNCKIPHVTLTCLAENNGTLIRQLRNFLRQGE
jgi:hypothetical protein